MVIRNCAATKTDATVIKDCVMSKDSPLYKTYGGYHTGVDLEAEDVYSMYDGTVVSIGRNTSGRSVIVQTGSSFCICYTGLLSTNEIKLGHSINAGQRIGSVLKKVHIEYLTKRVSIWPVRVSSETWYKTDTSQIFYGAPDEELDTPMFSALNINEISDYPSGVDTEISEESDYILSNNRGD